MVYSYCLSFNVIAFIVMRSIAQRQNFYIICAPGPNGFPRNCEVNKLVTQGKPTCVKAFTLHNSLISCRNYLPFRIIIYNLFYSLYKKFTIIVISLLQVTATLVCLQLYAFNLFKNISIVKLSDLLLRYAHIRRICKQALTPAMTSLFGI